MSRNEIIVSHDGVRVTSDDPLPQVRKTTLDVLKAWVDAVPTFKFIGMGSGMGFGCDIAEDNTGELGTGEDDE